MHTMIIYDNEGYIISQMQGSDLRTPVGVPYLLVEIPQGKYVASIDVSVTPNVPIYADIPKTEAQLLQAQIDDLNMAMAAMMGGV